MIKQQTIGRLTKRYCTALWLFFSCWPLSAEEQLLSAEQLAAVMNLPANASLYLECQQQQLALIDQPIPVIRATMRYQDKAQRRCEFAIHHGLQKQQAFSFSFQIKLTNVEPNDPYWHSYLQIHSFPDEGEQWRCPIAALESINGSLRMFNRWDLSALSDTSQTTCANQQNSMQHRTVFQGLNLIPNQWHEVEINGLMSLEDDGYLRITIDQQLVADVQGPNTYNDVKPPYLKLGIYKPTSWYQQNDIVVEYRDIHLQ